MNKEKLMKLKLEAMQKAEEFVEAMSVAKTNPTVSIDGETLKIWNELEEWGWLEKYPIEQKENQWIYIHMVAMTQYRHMKWLINNPPKDSLKKKTKWEHVMGRAGKR